MVFGFLTIYDQGGKVVLDFMTLSDAKGVEGPKMFFVIHYGQPLQILTLNESINVGIIVEQMTICKHIHTYNCLHRKTKQNTVDFYFLCVHTCDRLKQSVCFTKAFN